MSYARNAVDGCRIYYEDDGGGGVPVVLHGGVLDRVEDVRESAIAQSLPTEEFRAVFVDHRGLGRSDKPHDPSAYAMARRVSDVIAVLDDLTIERAHFVGMSWGGRLNFGIAAHAPARVRSLVIGRQQPYAWPDSPLTRVVIEALADSTAANTEALVHAFETFWETAFPADRRASWADNDRVALLAAVTTALSEGAVAGELGAWEMPCLIFMGAGDTDFLELAKRAAAEIPKAELLLLEEADHYAAHVTQDKVLIDAVLTTLRRA